MDGKPLIIAHFMVDEVTPQMINARSKPDCREVVKDFNDHAVWREVLLPAGFLYSFTSRSRKEYYMGIKKNKNAIIGTVDLDLNVFYKEKREVDSNLIHGVAYSPFEAFRMTNYPGEEAAAIEALESMGYGTGKDFSKSPDVVDPTKKQMAKITASQTQQLRAGKERKITVIAKTRELIAKK
jgi:hypothetical protein